MGMFAVDFLHGTTIFKTNSYIPVNQHIISFLIFLLIQKSSGNLPSRTEPYCKQTLGPILGPRQNERLNLLFCFPEYPHLIKTTIFDNCNDSILKKKIV